MSTTESSESDGEHERFASEPTPEHIDTPEEQDTPKEVTQVKTPDEESSEESELDIPAMAVYVDDKEDNITEVVKEVKKS